MTGQPTDQHLRECGSVRFAQKVLIKPRIGLRIFDGNLQQYGWQRMRVKDLEKIQSTFSTGEVNKGDRSFVVSIDAFLTPPGLMGLGPFGGSISSDQLRAHLRAKRELENALSHINNAIKGWRSSLEDHNAQKDPCVRYSPDTGDPIRRAVRKARRAVGTVRSK